MNCDDLRRDEMIEQYVLGQLAEAERDEFEKHYFDCDACLAVVTEHLALQAELRRRAQESTAEPIPQRPWSRWAWAAGAAAAALVAGVLLWPRARAPIVETPAVAPLPAPEARAAQPETPPAAPPESPTPASTPLPTLMELARVDPPPYEPVVVRGAAPSSGLRFREAMKPYRAADYSAVAAGLEEAAKLDPQAPEIGFYLGACYLLTNRTDEAITELRRTIALGETPFVEGARFYLAKALLKRGDLDAARAELTGVVHMGGGLGKDARNLLSELDRIRGSPP